jgi:hypothetical protein
LSVFLEGDGESVMYGAMTPSRDSAFRTRPVAMGVAFFLVLFGIQALADSAALHRSGRPLTGIV